VGSTIDPATIGNEHVRAHALEARLFRTALERALGQEDVPCRVVRERDLAGAATAELGRSAAEIAKVIAELGRAVGPPWRAEEKAAATAAWMLL
jgi:hypothetical protein